MAEDHGVIYRPLKGYKYELLAPFRQTLPDVFYTPGRLIQVPYIELGSSWVEGQIGYAWDGASGPTIDTPDTRRAALVHDMLYQLMRIKVLPLSLKGEVDALFRDLLREDGMKAFRAWYWWLAVKMFGRPVSEPPK